MNAITVYNSLRQQAGPRRVRLRRRQHNGVVLRVYIYIDAKLNRKRLEAVLVFVHILHLKPKYLPRSVRRGSECGNRIIDVYYHSNCWSIVYGFQDMTMGRTTDDGQTTQHRIIWPVRRPSSKRKALLPLHRKSHLTICTWMV